MAINKEQATQMLSLKPSRVDRVQNSDTYTITYLNSRFGPKKMIGITVGDCISFKRLKPFNNTQFKEVDVYGTITKFKTSPDQSQLYSIIYKENQKDDPTGDGETKLFKEDNGKDNTLVVQEEEGNFLSKSFSSKFGHDNNVLYTLSVCTKKRDTSNLQKQKSLDNLALKFSKMTKKDKLNLTQVINFSRNKDDKQKRTDSLNILDKLAKENGLFRTEYEEEFIKILERDKQSNQSKQAAPVQEINSPVISTSTMFKIPTMFTPKSTIQPAPEQTFKNTQDTCDNKYSNNPQFSGLDKSIQKKFIDICVYTATDNTVDDNSLKLFLSMSKTQQDRVIQYYNGTSAFNNTNIGNIKTGEDEEEEENEIDRIMATADSLKPYITSEVTLTFLVVFLASLTRDEENAIIEKLADEGKQQDIKFFNEQLKIFSTKETQKLATTGSMRKINTAVKSIIIAKDYPYIIDGSYKFISQIYPLPDGLKLEPGQNINFKYGEKDTEQNDAIIDSISSCKATTCESNGKKVDGVKVSIVVWDHGLNKYKLKTDPDTFIIPVESQRTVNLSTSNSNIKIRSIIELKVSPYKLRYIESFITNITDNITKVSDILNSSITLPHEYLYDLDLSIFETLQYSYMIDKIKLLKLRYTDEEAIKKRDSGLFYSDTEFNAKISKLDTDETDNKQKYDTKIKEIKTRIEKINKEVEKLKGERDKLGTVIFPEAKKQKSQLDSKITEYTDISKKCQQFIDNQSFRIFDLFFAIEKISKVVGNTDLVLKQPSELEMTNIQILQKIKGDELKRTTDELKRTTDEAHAENITKSKSAHDTSNIKQNDYVEVETTNGKYIGKVVTIKGTGINEHPSYDVDIIATDPTSSGNYTTFLKTVEMKFTRGSLEVQSIEIYQPKVLPSGDSKIQSLTDMDKKCGMLSKTDPKIYGDSKCHDINKMYDHGNLSKNLTDLDYWILTRMFNSIKVDWSTIEDKFNTQQKQQQEANNKSKSEAMAKQIKETTDPVLIKQKEQVQIKIEEKKIATAAARGVVIAPRSHYYLGPQVRRVRTGTNVKGGSSHSKKTTKKHKKCKSVKKCNVKKWTKRK